MRGVIGKKFPRPFSPIHSCRVGAREQDPRFLSPRRSLAPVLLVSFGPDSREVKPLHFDRQSCSSFFRARSNRATRALTVAVACALTVVLTQSGQGQSFDGGGGSAPLATQNATQRGRDHSRLSLGPGGDLEYVGMFQPDGTFRRTSKLTRFREAMNISPPESPAEQAARQGAAPPWMLSSNVRVVDDIEPPAHAIALPEAHAIPVRARNAMVSFLYGRLRVLGTPQHLTTDSRQRIIISDPSIPAIHVLDPTRKTSFSILGGEGHRLQSPAGVAVDKEDNIYVADSERGMVLVYDQYGRFLRYIGNFHGENMYQSPSGIAIDRKAGHLYLLDGPRHLLLMLDLQGSLLKRVGTQWDDNGGFGLKRRNDTGAFNNPTEIAVNDDEVAVLDSVGTRVQIMDLECHRLGGFSVQKASQEAARENGLALDQHGNIYVSYIGTSEVKVYNRVGGLVASRPSGINGCARSASTSTITNHPFMNSQTSTMAAGRSRRISSCS
jgi:sugar lactone lactonase YvrE